MKRISMMTAAALLALGVASPALAAPADVGLMMAAYAAETAGADAAAKTDALRTRHAKHQSGHAAGGDCDDCGECCESGQCGDCAGKKDDCENCLCAPHKHRDTRGNPCGQKLHA